VFGRAPGTGETLRAQWHFGLGAMPAYLLWRRLGPARALLLPVDLLEGTPPAQRRARRRVIGGPAYAQATLLTWTCWHFELALLLGTVAAVFIAIPADLLPDSLRSFWMLLRAGPPPWLELGFNAAAWLASSVVGPFYVAAGFGLYLNRRTETEAWDVELAFRRLRERLLAAAAAAPLALALACALSMPGLAQAQAGQAQAQAHEESEEDEGDEGDEESEPAQRDPATLAQVFGPGLADDSGFREAAARAYRDPLLGDERTVVQWQRKSRDQEQRDQPDLSGIARWLALLGEWALWLLAGLLLLAILLTAPRWLPWLRGSARRKRTPQAPVETTPSPVPDALPDDIAGNARRLWREGRQRDALALLYRGSVEAMASQAQVELPPGATEAQCLRASRKLPLEAARALFAQVVRVWQYAAYAGRLPAQDEFDALLDSARVQWGWRG
jgi:hypothetical protein